MKNIAVASAAACLLAVLPAWAEPLVSHFPQKGLAQFLATRFDLASIRSSFGPRRTPQLRTFADFGLKPGSASETEIVFERPGDWVYGLRIVARRDINDDGIEDIAACFTDRALNGGTYDVSTGLLITRYSADGYAVALNFALPPGLCEEWAR